MELKHVNILVSVYVYVYIYVFVMYVSAYVLVNSVQ